MSDKDRALEDRIARLEATSDIMRLKASYFSWCDRNDVDEIVRLFAEDSVLDLQRFGRHAGREQIRRHFESISKQFVFAAHLGANPIIDIVDETHAKGQWRLIIPATIRENNQNTAHWVLGAYDDTYVRVGGTWLFQEVMFHINFIEPHKGDWANSAVL